MDNDDEILEALRKAGPTLDETMVGVKVPDLSVDYDKDITAGNPFKHGGGKGENQPRKRPLHIPMLGYVTIGAYRQHRSGFSWFSVMGSKTSSSTSSSSTSSSSESPKSKTSSSYSYSSSSSSISYPSPPSPTSSSKHAIVPFEGGGIGWICAEEPIPMFSDTMEIPLKKYGPKDFRGQMFVPDEFLESVKRDTIRVTSVMADVPCFVAGRSSLMLGEVHVDVRKIRWWHPDPVFATVRVEGVRRGFGAKWPRFSDEEMNQNTKFWSLANEDFSSIVDHHAE